MLHSVLFLVLLIPVPPVRRVFRWECRATPREILRQTNTTFSSLDYSDAYIFLEKKKPFRSLFFWWFFLVMFQFAEPTTSIFGGPDMHVHEGSPVNLSCLVSQAVGQPEFFFWYHNGQVKQQQNKFKSFYTCVCCWWFSIVSYSHRQLRIEC
jgi:hypothetical protein